MIEEIPYGSAAYRQATALRDAVLRQPLGLSLTDEDVAGEAAQIHLAAVKDGLVCGTVILKPQPGGVMKLRQMAVAAQHQGIGLGRAIVATAEERARARGFAVIELHARRSAEGFYRRAGYQPFGDEFIEVGMPHIKMRKPLERAGEGAAAAAPV